MVGISEMNAASVSEAAVFYWRRLGVQPVKLEKKGKKPTDLKWTEKIFVSEDDVKKYFSKHQGNMGALLGNHSGNVAVLDFDTAEGHDAFISEMPMLLETLQSMGKKTFGHYWIRVDQSFQKRPIIRWNGDKKETLVDVLCNGAQVVVAPSIHPEAAEDGSEIKYKWLNEKPIITISTDSLMLAIKNVCKKLDVEYPFKTFADGEDEIKAATEAPSDIFKLVKEKVRISELTGTKDTRINCLVHKESTPNQAMTVYPETDTVYCFSCGFFGDVIALNAKLRGLPMIESARDLAQSHGIDVPQRHAQSTSTEDFAEITVELSTVNGFITAELVYQPDRIVLRRHTTNRRTGEESISERVMMRCGLRILNQVRFSEPENTTPMWHVVFGDEETTGTIDDIVKTLNEHSVVLCKREDARMVVSGLIDHVDPPVRKIYPAVGLYWNPINNCAVDATTTENFMAQNETQQQLFNSFTRGYSEPALEERKEIYQASVDFIRSMPRLNRFAAYITRCYGCLAPLSYELKRSNLGVFPYLYLFGSKGSSKTHIAMVSATYCWGESEPLNGQSVDSSFRLGTEFSATKFPRVIDEAHDAFRKYQEIFKAGATSMLATKRGNKDKTMDSYPAFCTFILTSNLPPIYEEEDAQGGVADRVLVVNCARDDDFDNKKYQVAFAKLNSPASRIIGRDILANLTSLLKEKGLSGISKEIFDIATEIQTRSPKITARRAYCLAELVYGNRIYSALLKQNGIEPIFTEESVLAEIIDKLGLTSDDRAYIQSFMQFAMGVSSMEEKFRAGTGIYFEEESMVITVPAITLANQKMGVKNPTVRNLADLEREFIRFGLRNTKSSIHRIGQMVFRGIKISLKEYGELAERQEPHQAAL